MTKTANDLYKIADNYHTGDNLDMAKKFYELAIAKDPKHYDSIRWLADIFLDRENYDQAIKLFEKAKKINSKDSDLYNDLGLCYYENCDYEKSLNNYKVGLEIKSSNETIHSNFGKALYERHLENEEEAKKIAKWWVGNFPDSKDASVIGSAILGENMAQQNTEYVKQIFDDFAEDFDDKLAELNYKAPEFLAKIWKKHNSSTVNSILDAGCGTGLLAPHITNSCNKLYGVDLSPEMLNLAKERELYSDLSAQDLNKYLSLNENKFNGIIAADVLCYFGDLNEVFESTYKSLLASGGFAFSVEKNNTDDNDYLLTPSGRYVHKQSYIKSVLKNTGFEILEIKTETLRTEHDNPVRGLITIAKKS